MKRRIFALALACLTLAALLSACGETKEPDLRFTNNLDTEIHNVYLSPAEAEDWNDPVSVDKLGSGHTMSIDFSKAGEGAGPGLYDFGVIDENAMNYDLYEVTLAVGDKIEISGNADGATYTVTHADGTQETFDAWIYAN